MPIVSIHLSDTAYEEFKRIPKGKRSRVLTQYLVSRSRDIIQPEEGMSGHELADIVVELRQVLSERELHVDALRNQIRRREFERNDAEKIIRRNGLLKQLRQASPDRWGEEE